MSEKQSKFISLGPKKMSLTGRAFYNSTGQTGFSNKPTPPVISVPQPQIRYLLVQHPQFDSLVKQLTALRTKYDQLLVKFEQKSTQESLKANIKQVIESTHQIEAKMSRIVEDSNNMQSKDSQKQNNQNAALNQIKIQHQKQCLKIIQTVNLATQKIQQLQQKNSKLMRQTQSHKEWKQALDKENKRLRLMLQKMQGQKQGQIEKLNVQLKGLKASKQYEKEQSILAAKGHKIRNAQYLQDSRNSHMAEEISGLSRLSINGEISRVSKIYQ